MRILRILRLAKPRIFANIETAKMFIILSVLKKILCAKIMQWLRKLPVQYNVTDNSNSAHVSVVKSLGYCSRSLVVINFHFKYRISVGNETSRTAAELS